MKRKYFSTISASLIVGLVVGSSLFWLGRALGHDSEAIETASYRRGASASTSAVYPMTYNRPGRRSVIKVHTDRGVITLNGTVDSWNQVEDALFLAESIADVQMVNNEIGWSVQTD